MGKVSSREIAQCIQYIGVRTGKAGHFYSYFRRKVFEISLRQVNSPSGSSFEEKDIRRPAIDHMIEVYAVIPALASDCCCVCHERRKLNWIPITEFMHPSGSMLPDGDKAYRFSGERAIPTG